MIAKGLVQATVIHFTARNTAVPIFDYGDFKTSDSYTRDQTPVTAKDIFNIGKVEQMNKHFDEFVRSVRLRRSHDE